MKAFPIDKAGDRSGIVAADRLRAVRRSGLLDTLPEPTFDDLTRLASIMTRAPFAFATIVDDERSFWKSCVGLPEGAPRQNTVDESFCQYIVQSEREFIIPDTLADERTRANPSVDAMNVRAWAGFPIFSPDGYVLGSFCVVDTSPRAWSPLDVDVLRTLASCATREIALRAVLDQEREARMRSDALAQSLQDSLLPPELPNIPGFDVAACYQPAGRGVDVVGDFYDVFQARDDEWNFLVGDVCGKGVEAAKIAALARYSVRASALSGLRPDAMLMRLNAIINAHNQTSHLFLTALYGVISMRPGGAVIRIASGGHAAPTLRRADGRLETVDVRGALIGVFEDYALDAFELHLAAGESLIMYTDGVSEAGFGDHRMSEASLREILAGASGSARDIAEHLKDAVMAFNNGVASDDIAILVIQAPA